jgi:hypothetical protein
MIFNTRNSGSIASKCQNIEIIRVAAVVKYFLSLVFWEEKASTRCKSLEYCNKFLNVAIMPSHLNLGF